MPCMVGDGIGDKADVAFPGNLLHYLGFSYSGRAYEENGTLPDLWNFVLACPRCNIRKSNRLPATDYLIKIESRNDKIVQLSSVRAVDNFEILEREFSGYDDGLLRRMWGYAKMSGIKETIRI